MDWRKAPLGAHIGPGWEKIVDSAWLLMCGLDPEIKADQVKEKFGGLRIYFDSTSTKLDDLYSIVDAAVTLSFKTCEVCGEPGELDKENGWWLKTLCPTHKELRKDKTVPQIIMDLDG